MPRDAYFLHRLRDAEGRQFKVVEGSILEYDGELRLTAVLGLNIFHHFLKTQERFDGLCGILDRLECRLMFFQPHLTSEPQMRDAYRNYSEDEFVKFVQERTGLGQAELLGHHDDGRSLCKLSK